MAQNTPFILLLMVVAFATAAEARERLPDPADISAVEKRLNLSAAHIHPDDKGPDLSGILPGGDPIEVDLHQDGTVDKVEAPRHGTIPLGEVMPLLRADVAEALYYATALTADTRLREMELGEEIELEGPGFKAEFTASGHLKEWKRD